MEINNSFEVPLPPKDAWKTLMDIPRIAPCMPGAELTGVLDKDTYNGKVSVRLGPVALTFAGQVKFTDIDEAGYPFRSLGRRPNDRWQISGLHPQLTFAFFYSPDRNRGHERRPHRNRPRSERWRTGRVKRRLRREVDSLGQRAGRGEVTRHGGPTDCVEYPLPGLHRPSLARPCVCRYLCRDRASY